jgi:drug/metabolite transporter (DMT)-like permease
MKIDVANRPEKKLPLAALFALLYAVFYSLLGAAVKIAAEEVSVEAIALWRCLVGALLLFLWIWHRKPLSYFKTPQWKMQSIRSIAGLIANILYFYALKSLPVSDATLLLFTSPIFIPFVGLLWFKISLHREMWWGMILAFIGIGILLNPGQEIFQLGALIGLLSGIAAAVAYVSLRMAHYSEPTERTLFYNFGISSLAMIVVSLFEITVWIPNLWLITIGLLALVSQIMLTLAAKYAPVRILSPFFYFSVIFGMLLDWWIWDTSLTSSIVWGCSLIVLGNILMVVLYPKDDLKIRK